MKTFRLAVAVPLSVMLVVPLLFVAPFCSNERQDRIGAALAALIKAFVE